MLSCMPHVPAALFIAACMESKNGTLNKLQTYTVLLPLLLSFIHYLRYRTHQRFLSCGWGWWLCPFSRNDFSLVVLKKDILFRFVNFIVPLLPEVAAETISLDAVVTSNDPVYITHSSASSQMKSPNGTARLIVSRKWSNQRKSSELFR